MEKSENVKGNGTGNLRILRKLVIQVV